VVARDDSLSSYLDRHAQSVLEQLSTASFSQRVQRELWEEMSEGQPTVKSVAAALGVSARTLQRRLSEEGLSFADLLDRFRDAGRLRGASTQ
jgi:tape measure domain-containing protein